MTRILAAHQANYAPYLGFLHKASHADVFIVQDDLKYVKNDYGNRNRVQAEDSWRWLTIPVHANDSSTFRTATAADPRWPRDHTNILRSKYLRAAHKDRLDAVYAILADHARSDLAAVSIDLIRELFARFEVTTPMMVEGELGMGDFDDPNQRLIALCRRFECDTYLSGTGAHAYIDERQWEEAGIGFLWSDFEAAEYDRGGAPWIPNLSALDALAHADDLPSLIA